MGRVCLGPGPPLWVVYCWILIGPSAVSCVGACVSPQRGDTDETFVDQSIPSLSIKQ